MVSNVLGSSASATATAKGTPSNATQEPAQPSWRQPPPRRRNKVRRPAATPGAVLAGIGLVGRRVAHSLTHLPKIRVHWLWVLLPLLAVVGYGVAQLFTSYEFYVYGAEIVGNQRVAIEDIYAASEVDQKNILWVRPGAVAQRIEALPGIASAKVSVRPPNSVRIEVKERTPLVVWQAATKTAWVADDGVTLQETGDAPALTLVDDNETAGDAQGRLRKQIVSDIQALHGLRPDLAQIHFGAAEGLYFRAPEGWTVYLGTSGNVANKLALLESIRPRIAAERTRPTVIDLRIDGKAYIR